MLLAVVKVACGVPGLILSILPALICSHFTPTLGDKFPGLIKGRLLMTGLTHPVVWDEWEEKLQGTA